MFATASLIVQRRPAEKVEHSRGVAEDQRGLHVVRAQAVREHQGVVNEQQEHRNGAADRPREQGSDGEGVGEGGAAGHGVDEAQAKLVVRQQAGLDRRGDQPEFQRWFFEEDVGFARAALWLEPVADLEDTVDRKRVDRFVGLEVRLPQADKAAAGRRRR